MPRTKSFWNEVRYGTLHALTFPKNMIQFKWTIQLFKARKHIYKKAFQELKQEDVYEDGWRETETPSTRTLD